MYISEAKNNAPCYDVNVWVQFLISVFLLLSCGVVPSVCGCWKSLWFISPCACGTFLHSFLSQASDLLLHLYFLLSLFVRDEAVVSQAIELNEELHKVLVRHDALLSVQPTTTVASNLEEEEEEDAESLYRRYDFSLLRPTSGGWWPQT